MFRRQIIVTAVKQNSRLSAPYGRLKISQNRFRTKSSLGYESMSSMRDVYGTWMQEHLFDKCTTTP